MISSKDENDEECVMHSKSDNIEIVISDEVNEIRVSRKFLKAIKLFRRKHRKIYTFTVPIEKEVAKIDKNGKISPKIYFTYYSLLIAQDFWQGIIKSCS